MDRTVSAVFLDRDGVINENRPDHVKCWDEFRFLPGVFDALAELAVAGLPVFVVTNQAVISRGIVSQCAVDDINARMMVEIARHGGRVEAVLYCPHSPNEGCSCRKPQPGLLITTARRYGLDLDRCYLVGDALSDIQAGQAVGCETILVLTGRGMQQHEAALSAGQNGYRLASDLSEAVKVILQNPASTLSLSYSRA
ncbi:MAG: D-glycero-beta-D-manno-heptose 1,7-bisphosphate 7-phosphatase [Chloroflexi bacterium]|nr:D-glycero-beta-D-manno-heptose 1,7-bisphosphate 7-phosphatase [Chloroflexota bacterium]